MDLTERTREDRATALRVARAALRLKQEDVAQLAGLDQATISKAERGRASDATYDRIEAAIKWHKDDLGFVYGGDGEQAS